MTKGNQLFTTIGQLFGMGLLAATVACIVEPVHPNLEDHFYHSLLLDEHLLVLVDMRILARLIPSSRYLLILPLLKSRSRRILARFSCLEIIVRNNLVCLVMLDTGLTSLLWCVCVWRRPGLSSDWPVELASCESAGMQCEQLGS
jgi:hypothetical protein